MLLAHNFVEKCLNYSNEWNRIKNELEEKGEDWWVNQVNALVSRDLFVIEVKDFHRAIALCKVFKRSVQKKAYEMKLKQFVETGTLGSKYSSSSNADTFFSILESELIGSRRSRYNNDREMLVSASLNEYFPEYGEINAGIQLLQFCKGRDEMRIYYEAAEKRFKDYQEKFSLIQVGETAGKSVQEIWSGLQEYDQKRMEGNCS